MATEMVVLEGPNGPFTVTRKQADGVYAHFKPKKKTAAKKAVKKSTTPSSEE